MVQVPRNDIVDLYKGGFDNHVLSHVIHRLIPEHTEMRSTSLMWARKATDRSTIEVTEEVAQKLRALGGPYREVVLTVMSLNLVEQGEATCGKAKER